MKSKGNPKLNILLIEDNPGDARLIDVYLKRELLGSYELVTTDRLEKGLNKLAKKQYDVLLVDLSLPDSSGYDTFLKIYRNYPSIPIIVLTGQSNEHLGFTAVQVGAQDFITKNTLSEDLLNRAVLYAIERSRVHKKNQAEIIEGQEQERKRIAEELHDGLGQVLSAVNLNLKKLETGIDKLEPENQKAYHNALGLIERAVIEVRGITRNLMPGILENFGLTKAIERLCDEVDQSDALTVTFQQINMKGRFDKSIEITLYRVAQELLNNILKYAEASEVNVQLINNNDRLVLMVEDDGVGFDDVEIKKKEGLGLKNIEARVTSLGGVLAIDSKKGEGTSATVEIPLN